VSAAPRSWLLVKGMRQDARYWFDVPDRLAARVPGRVLTLDLPGVGSAAHRPAPWDVDGLVDDLRARFLEAAAPGDGPWGLVGLSLAGMVALRWAARFPEELAHVVVGNSSDGRHSWPWRRLRLANLPRMAATARRRGVARERASLDLVVALRGPAERDALAAHYAAWQREIPCTPATLARQLVAGATFRGPAAVEVPLTFLVGRGDRFVDPRCTDALAAAHGAPLIAHPTAGHDLSVDAPDWLIARIAALSAPPTG
jgi:pimeloyl-ACP methyl ester carboxylesterase